MTPIFPNLPDPVMVLSSAPWAGDGTLARVLGVLNDGAPVGRPQALLVGGCVRNAVRGASVHDYDIATSLSVEEVRARAEAAGCRVVETGVDHGSVMVVVNGRGFEVTRLRQDIETDGRHAVVAPTGDWAVDAARRDFTMNTLYADASGAVYEFIPGALRDAQDGRVRFVGDPQARVAEDYLRILRFFRFHAFYGAGEMDAPGVLACRVAAQKLGTLSRERVTAELCRWLSAENPVLTIKTASENNILKHVLPVPCDISWFGRLISVQRAVLWPDMLSRLLVLASGDVDATQAGLRLSNNEINYLEDIVNVNIEDISALPALRRAAVRYRHMPVLARWLMDVAKQGVPLSPQDFAALRDWVPPIFPVTGADLIAQGMMPGPALGVRLPQLREEWIRSGFQLTRAALLADI